ncbi:hypothetical protein VTK26DRAFT_809 [Humicola hyalothermophila]
MTSTEERGSSDGPSGRASVEATTNDTATTETTRLLGANGSGERWGGYEEFEGLPWWRRPSVWFLLAPYALFTLAFGGTIVPKLNLIVDLVCQRHLADRAASDPDFTFTPVIPGGDNGQCFAPEVQKLVATFSLVLNVLVGSLSSLTAPKLGALSDRYGRKRMMIICSLGGIANEIITILAAKYPQSVPYQWMILGSFFDGLAGSFTAGNVLSHAYASDCTPPSKRGVAIGYLHSCLFGGLAFGPLLAGYLVEWTGSLLSIFYIALGSHVFFVVFMALVIPESLSKRLQLQARERHAIEQAAAAPIPEWAGSIASRIPFSKQMSRITHSIKTANPLAPLDILFPAGPENKKLRRNLLILAFIDIIILGTAMSAGTIIILYVESTFHWRNLESSRFLSMTSMVRVVTLVGVLPLINYLFRTRPAAAKKRRQASITTSSSTTAPTTVAEKNTGADKLDIWILRAALLSDVAGVTGYIFARSGAVFVACAVVTAVGGLGSATIQAALSKHVPPARVGQLLGAVGLLHSLARVVAPIVFNELYAATVESFPQAFFVLLASLFAAALVASFGVRPNVFMRGEEEEEPVPRSRSTRSDWERQEALEDDELLPA